MHKNVCAVYNRNNKLCSGRLSFHHDCALSVPLGRHAAHAFGTQPRNVSPYPPRNAARRMYCNHCSMYQMHLQQENALWSSGRTSQSEVGHSRASHGSRHCLCKGGPATAFLISFRFGNIVCADSSLWQGGKVHFASPGKRICFGSSVYLWAPAEMHFAGAEKCIFVFPDGRKQNLDGIEFAKVPAVARKLFGGALSEVPAKMPFAGPTKCIFLFPEGREHCLAGIDIAMVPTALRKP